MDDKVTPYFSTNFTETPTKFEEPPARGTLFIVIVSLITVIIGIVAVCGNIAVIAVSSWSETLRVQTGNRLIVNLSLLDTMNGLFVMIPSAISVAADNWVFGNMLCDVHCCLQYCNACASSVNLGCISIDRAIAVAYPLQYHQKMTSKVMTVMCIFVWFQGFTLSLGAVVPNWIIWNYWETLCSVTWDNNPKVLKLMAVAFAFCFLVPAIIMGGCNALIIFSARRSKKNTVVPFIRVNEMNNVRVNQNTNNKSRDSNNKTVKTMVVVIITYYACFTPFSFLKLSKSIVGEVDIPPWFDYLVTMFIFISSATNPFIYAILRKDYRDAFKRLPSMFKERIHRIF